MPPYAANIYDAVTIYANAVKALLTERRNHNGTGGSDPKNVTHIMNKIFNTTYRSE